VRPDCENPTALTPTRPPIPRAAKKRVRVIKKIRIARGLWKFISLDRIGNRYVWDKRPGYYFVEWWEGKRRCRELAGETPSQAVEVQRRKRNELIGELVTGGSHFKSPWEKDTAMRIADAIELFTDHIKTHSPAKPASPKGPL
jgi:hypothetical protein